MTCRCSTTDDGPEVARVEFRIGDAFPADDAVARYVMRLSMALGDVRIAMNYLVREEQPHYERLYFVRLAALHLRELVLLIDATQAPQPIAPCATREAGAAGPVRRAGRRGADRRHASW